MPNRRIVIVGFMGCGKTTVARALAHQLVCELIDLDSFITEKRGRSPAEIIAEDGEAAFRRIETRLLHEALKNIDARVIALGGGAWTIAANRDLISQYDCLSVWLDVPFELCWDRIVASAHTIRPMAPDRESAKRLYLSRRASYELADLRVQSGDDALLEISRAV